MAYVYDQWCRRRDSNPHAYSAYAPQTYASACSATPASLCYFVPYIL